MKNIAIALILVIILGVGVYVYSSSKNSQTTAIPTNSNNTQQNNVTPSAYENELVPEETEQISPINYVEYSPEALAEAQEKGRAVLFFHASWCPTCKVANEDLLANASQLPADVTILKTDYDTYTDLKQKYGITYQHTFVQVDANGDEVTKWNGGGVEEIIQNLAY